MRHFSFVVLLLCMNWSCFAQFGGTQSGGGLDGYTSKTDIDYVGDNHVGHKLDIYYPNDNNATHNVIIHIYGSAWGSNNSKGSADLGTVGKAALEAGYIFVTPNHRTYNDALYPAQINDIKAVVRYLRGNAESLKIDDSFIAISGFSSGGHLASLMGVTRNVEKDYTVGSATMDIEGELGNYTQFSSWVDAVCDWSGPVDCRDKGCGNPIQMSPEDDMVGGCNDQQCPDKHALLGANTFIDKEDAPVMVVHGSTDNIVPQCEGEKFYNNLKAAGVDCEYYPNGGGHGVNGEFTDEMITFFNRIRSSHPTTPENGISLSASPKTIGPGATVTLTAKPTITEGSTFNKIELYQNNSIIATWTNEPYSFAIENLDLGTYSFKAIMTIGGDSTFTSDEVSVTVKLTQSPYDGTAQVIPGKIEMENYDEGDDGFAYHDSDDKNEGDGNIRTNSGVDIVEAGNGYAIGYTAVGEWVEFTIDAKNTDIYEWSANVASGSTSAGFKLYIDDTAISDAISIPQTASNSWDTYEIISGKTPSITEGKHILKVEITGANGNIDYIEFKSTTITTGLDQDVTVFQIEKSYEVYSLLGTKIGDITIKQGDNIQEVVKNLVGGAGTYAIRNIHGSSRLLIIK